MKKRIFLFVWTFLCILAACMALNTQGTTPLHAAMRIVHPQVKVIGISPYNASNFMGPVDIAAVSTNDVWAAGYYYDTHNVSIPVLEHFNGVQWSKVATVYPGGNGQFSRLAAAATNNVWAVADVYINHVETAMLEHWNGKLWQVSNFVRPTISVTQLTISTIQIKGNTVWIAGTYRYLGANNVAKQAPLVELYDGQAWHVLQAGLTAQSIGTLAVLTASDIWAAGNGRVFHYDGVRWREVSHNMLDAPASICAITSSDVWLVGVTPNPSHAIAEHWNGQVWKTLQTASAPVLAGGMQVDYFASVFALAPGDVWATGYIISVGGGVAQLIEHWDGQAWSVINSSTLSIAPIKILALHTLIAIAYMQGNLVTVTY